ncbi:hypothetical protein EVAR_12220_1 [Eumeta japonica]|uniref:Uncharacterized protein n=1 Tax=Eumeta variegata TaxID=151549 RepID=A0A4C1UHX9_EUMVA|nr:hypothetical protein EVAR_12220_1 [Eumeta japonica]
MSGRTLDVLNRGGGNIGSLNSLEYGRVGRWPPRRQPLAVSKSKAGRQTRRERWEQNTVLGQEPKTRPGPGRERAWDQD